MVEGISHEALLRAAEELRQVSEAPQAGHEATEGEQGSFEDALTRLIGEVDEAQKEADASLKSLASGEPTSIQDVVLKMEQADISFRLMKQIRDKLLQAYKEVMSMQG